MKITRRKHIKASTSTNRKISAARVGKTKEVIVLQGNYGYGWDDLMEYEVTQSREANDDLKTYRENERNASHRIVRRRVKNPNWAAPADRFSVIQYDGGFRYKMGKPVKFSDMEEAIAHATDLWKHGGFEVVLKDAVTGCNIQLIPLDEYRTEKNLRIFRETVGSDGSVKSATSTKRKYVTASERDGNYDTKFTRGGIVYYIEILNSDAGSYVAKWWDSSDNGVGYNNKGWVSLKNDFGRNYGKFEPASMRDYLFVISDYDRTPNMSIQNLIKDKVAKLLDYDSINTRPVRSSTSTKRKYTVKASKSVTASEDGPLQVCRSCLLGIESHEGDQVVYDTIENYAWDEDAEPLICDWCEDEVDILYQITPDEVESSTDISADSTMRDRFVDPENFVFFFNGNEMYRGTGDGFSEVIAGLCKDESTNLKFQEWCNQFGDPFDFDGTPKDTAYVFTWLVEQERMEMDDFYLDGSGILNFEICNASDMVQSSTNIRTSIDDLVCL